MFRLDNFSPPYPRFGPLQASLSHLNFVQFALFAAWILTLIALPIVKYLWGDAAVTWGVALGVVFQAVLVLYILEQAWGAARTLRMAAIVALLGFTSEAMGTATGLPFGAYGYTDRLQPQLAHVPLIIPLAWLMMLPAAWAVARLITGNRSRLTFIGLSALALTAWDLFLDPQMVAWGFWVWEQPGGYFGIPWLNFFGWALTAAVMTALVRPKDLPLPPLLLIYIITWFLETIGLLFFWGLPEPALVGFVGMGSLIMLAWMRSIRVEV